MFNIKYIHCILDKEGNTLRGLGCCQWPFLETIDLPKMKSSELRYSKKSHNLNLKNICFFITN